MRNWKVFEQKCYNIPHSFFQVKRVMVKGLIQRVYSNIWFWLVVLLVNVYKNKKKYSQALKIISPRGRGEVGSRGWFN